MQFNINTELQTIKNKHDIANIMPWGVSGGQSWIMYKQTDENDYCVEIFMHGNFLEYKAIKDDIIAALLQNDSIFDREDDLKASFGYKRHLFFIDKSKKTAREEMVESKGNVTFNIGTFNAQGANVVFGNAENTQLLIDNSVVEIGKLIDEKGGSDKEELHSILEEAKVMATEMSSTGKIKKNQGFFDKLNSHVAKHGWFYGAVLQLLGQGAMAFLI